jgi:hypothetical protein
MEHAKECDFIVHRDHPHIIFIFHLQLMVIQLEVFASQISHALYVRGCDEAEVSKRRVSTREMSTARSGISRSLADVDSSFHANQRGSSLPLFY